MIGRGIVNDDEFEAGPCLGMHRMQGIENMVLMAVTGHNDRNERGVSHRSADQKVDAGFDQQDAAGMGDVRAEKFQRIKTRRDGRDVTVKHKAAVFFAVSQAKRFGDVVAGLTVVDASDVALAAVVGTEGDHGLFDRVVLQGLTPALLAFQQEPAVEMEAVVAADGLQGGRVKRTAVQKGDFRGGVRDGF